MYKDALAAFASAQSTTTSVAHSDVINTLAAGDAYVNDFVVFQVSVAFTATGTPNMALQLQVSDNSSFVGSSTFTIVQSQTFVASQLTAGKFWAVRIPPHVGKYIRLYNKVTTVDAQQHFDAGTWNSWITPDIDLEINRRYQL